MKLIKPYYEIWEQVIPIKKMDDDSYTYSSKLTEEMYKHIERVGRVCYKSEDKITNTSHQQFVERLIKAEHYAMLEHGTIYLTIYIPKKAWSKDVVDKYYRNKYSKVTNTYNDYDYTYYVTTNYRVILENHWEDDLKYISAPTEHHAKRITVHFVCDNGVAREFTRHRVFSFAQESTRYCNYSKDKFGKELIFIKPCWNYEGMYLESTFQHIEDAYLTMIERGYKPQEARTILPLGLKTELIMTGFIDDWKHFFDLRALGTTGAPHPQAKELAEPLYNEFKEKYYAN